MPLVKREGNDKIEIKFQLISSTHFEAHLRYNAPVIDLMKKVTSAKYDPTTKNWSFHLSDYYPLLEKLKTLQNLNIGSLPLFVIKVFNKVINNKTNADLSYSAKDLLPKSLFEQLMPFQVTAVDRLDQVNYASAPFRIIIFDESHFLKNWNTVRTKTSTNLAKNAKHVILLSGTPALSRPVELFSQISIVNPEIFPTNSFHEFGLRYCQAKRVMNHWDYTGSDNLNELQILLMHCIMIRRNKTEVLEDLPPKMRKLIYLDPSKIKETKQLRQMSKETNLAKNTSPAQILEYYHETGLVKIPAVHEYILDLVESGQKFVLFAHHSEMMSNLTSLLTKRRIEFIKIDGSTNPKDRNRLVECFQNKETCQVAVLSITAACTGLTLTAAKLVVFAELAWNPGQLIQAEDRVYRIGQRESVTIQYLIAENTVDTYLWNVLEQKLKVLKQAGLNKETFDGVSKSELSSNSGNMKNILDYFEKSEAPKKQETKSTFLSPEESAQFFNDEDEEIFDMVSKSESSTHSENRKNICDHSGETAVPQKQDTISTFLSPEESAQFFNDEDEEIFDMVSKSELSTHSGDMKNIRDHSGETTPSLNQVTKSALLTPEESANFFEDEEIELIPCGGLTNGILYA
ncbi:SWI/SNF- matrix-associated actin-dependent regulator of chromatin subfamily A-like protein 1 [Cichlidogyrus casuarinus]|uniref:SWI/SNF- matrix-associated actin-dependent regulator of chromatin subfamily A-like protein 1 n=1 Tax=Cichlidogyrus casuarinus TaxID=1844966 RepID=A0ABD2QBT1_9PLAT